MRLFRERGYARTTHPHPVTEAFYRRDAASQVKSTTGQRHSDREPLLGNI